MFVAAYGTLIAFKTNQWPWMSFFMAPKIWKLHKQRSGLSRGYLRAYQWNFSSIVLTSLATCKMILSHNRIIPSINIPGHLDLMAYFNVCKVSIYHCALIMVLCSRKSMNSKPLKSKKKVIVTFLELAYMTLNCFGGCESMCFYCWLWCLLSGSKWYHISSPTTYRTGDDIIHHDTIPGASAMLTFYSISAPLSGKSVQSTVHRFLGTSDALSRVILWLMAQHELNVFSCQPFLTTVFTTVITERIITQWACLGWLLSFNGIQLS